MQDNLKIKGFFKVTDLSSGKIILEKNNSINYENMTVAISNTMIGNSEYQINSMVFGNGGSIVNGTGAITYLPPNVNNSSSTLYNQTYKVSNLTSSTSNDTSNYMTVKHLSGETYSDIIITCVLGYDEPSDQSSFDNTNLTDSYVFDEIGIETQNGLLLTHAIFAPTPKALNVSLEIQYTIRISAV